MADLKIINDAFSWQLWENEGLHLKLIPYGCLATSTNTGFIEVVKNAKTISEVNLLKHFMEVANIVILFFVGVWYI